MRSQNKSRNRKNNNRRPNSGGNMGNVVNRVFDSSGPDGKVRGTPQQIIDKYQSLSRDAQLSGDRIAAENFLQHCEHYTRMLGAANREANERREAQEAQQKAQEAQREAQEAQRKEQQKHTADTNPQPQQHHAEKPAQVAVDVSSDQPDIAPAPGELFPGEDHSSSLVVDTPEAGGNSQPAPKKRTPRPRKPRPSPEAAPIADTDGAPTTAE